ncbi:hypothetical protein [Streptomyces buecherae]|uniref:hypothetical protein n=1 Tax=Streptomyces buecherae TaxID=2763006 RepID=UPI001C25A075|nr:hypothetical protein [Streptomyces buecherae]
MTSWAPPPGDDVSLLPAGRQWAMVCAPTALGEWVTTYGCSGAMIAGPAGSAWLIPPEDTSGWRRMHQPIARHVDVIARGHALVPHAGRTRGPGPHWVHPPGIPHGWLTAVPLLYSDLAIAAELHYGPAPPTAPCLCGGRGHPACAADAGT